ncbi:MAG: ABC transporter permease, partial [Treponema sp.]|nr:ABC transporter permease [Treponema sp.]
LVNRVEVSALTTPDNELSRRAAQDPRGLSIKEWETWYCTAYVSAICYQIDEVITDAVSKPIRQVAESEGAILEKTQLLMLLITILSLAGSALGISNLVTASVMERASEIGLLKAVGAYDAPVSALVLAEIIITGIIGGTGGYFAGLGFAQIIGQSVFGSAIDIKPMVIPLVAVLVFLVTMAGSIPSIRLLLSLRPAEVLHGR